LDAKRFYRSVCHLCSGEVPRTPHNNESGSKGVGEGAVARMESSVIRTVVLIRIAQSRHYPFAGRHEVCLGNEHLK
jgi:hypothetical protein